MKDTNGRDRAKLSELKIGCFVELTGFDCVDDGCTRKVKHFDGQGFYIDCDLGFHFLVGELETDNDSLIGVYHAQS